MSFTGCDGSMMANSGLIQSLKSAFEGVEKILTGKKFPQYFKAKRWLDIVIIPVFIMMKFVRAAQEADWSLHLVALKAMLPYFAAAGR